MLGFAPYSYQFSQDDDVYRPTMDNAWPSTSHDTYIPPEADWDLSSPMFSEPRPLFASLNVSNVPSCFSSEPSTQVYADFLGSQSEFDLNGPPSNEQVHFGMLGGEPDSGMCTLAGCRDHEHDHTHRDQFR